MILSKDEAICLILELSENKEISSLTKLNKLLARLNLHLIPTKFDFALNKFGSYCQELKLLEGNDKFAIKEYEMNDKIHQKYILKDRGLQLAKDVEENKIRKIMNDNAYMFDYYLLFALEKKVIPFLKSNIKSKGRDEKITFRYYNYIIDSVKDKHPFSLENPDLKELVIQ